MSDIKIWAISDTHFNHENIKTYCDRPDNFTERIIKNWQRLVRPNDVVIHFGDVFIGKPEGWFKVREQLTGRLTLVLGNHDKHSATWWMRNGCEFACDALIFRRCYITHKPARELPPNCDLNLFGHLHNIWDGFHPDDPKDQPDENYISRTGKLWHPWQRLFAIEYTNYSPVEFEKFVSQPDKFKARGVNKDVNKNFGSNSGDNLGAVYGERCTLPRDSAPSVPVSEAVDARDPLGLGSPSSCIDDGGTDSAGERLESERE